MHDFFRKEVTQNHLSEMGVPLRITTRWMKFFTFLFIIFVVSLISIIYFGSYSRKASVDGFLLPDIGIIKVTSPREGRIAKIHVNEGQYVNERDILFTINVGTESIGGNTTETKYLSLINRRELISDELKYLDKIEIVEKSKLIDDIRFKANEIILSEKELSANSENIQLLDEILSRHQKLSAIKLTTVTAQEETKKELMQAKLQYISQEKSLLILQNELDQLNSDLSVFSEKQSRIKSQLKQTMIDINQSISELDDERAILIRAPANGIVTRLTNSVGSTADIDIILLSIIPDGADLDAYIYIPSKDAGFINIGSEILIRYEAYPFQKFGAHKATIETISQAPVNSTELPILTSGSTIDPLYVVTAKLEKPYITVSDQNRPLQVGAKFKADLILEQNQIWEWLLGPLRSLRTS